jgi:signal transduction histidine kinase
MWALVAFAALSALAYVAVDRLNAVERKARIHLAYTTLLLERERLATEASEYSWWDEGSRNVFPTPDPDWVTLNIGRHAHQNLDITLTVVVDRADRLHLAVVDEVPTAIDPSFIDDPDIQALIAKARRSPMDPVAGAGGYAMFDGQVHAIGVAAYTPEATPNGAKPDLERAVLIYGRRLDAAFFATQADRFGLDQLRLVPVDSDDAFMVLRSRTNKRLAGLTWRIRTPGSELITTLVAPAVILLVVLGLITWRFLIRAQTMSRALADASKITDLQNEQLREREAEAVRSRNLAELAVEAKDEAMDSLRRRNAELDTARHEAMESSHAKTMFLASMSHELRTPLNSIIGFSEILRDERFGPLGTPRYIEYAGNIHASGGHLLELINDVLDIAKIEAGKMSIEREAVLVDELCGRTCDLFREQALAGDLTLSFSTKETAIPISADPRAVRQILINLLSNAIKFTRKGDVINVSTVYPEAGDGVEIIVSDTGVGIPETHLESVFRPFERVNEAANDQGGTGLGLALVKALAELHGGAVNLVSEIGHGTTVTVWLPRDMPQDMPRDGDRP